jgi:hypothetical protein
MENIMNLHENEETFRDAIRAASDQFGIRDVFVEKDYWVTFLLKRLSQSENSKNVVFKGGTSLSKVYKLIARFSEDVDLAILKSEGQTETQVRRMIRAVEKEITSGFEEVYIEGITSKQTKYRKTAYNYNRIINPNTNTSVQEKLILEINSFVNPVPFETLSTDSLIAQFLLETGNEKAVKEYQLEPFELNVLVPKSTLIEKVLSLIRLSFCSDSIDKIKPKVRHFYDIYFLSNSQTCKEYLTSGEFKNDFNRMFDEDKTKFNDPEEWLKAPYSESPIFKSFDEIWSKVKGTYETDFRLLVHGEFPAENQIIERFKSILKILI